MSASYATRALDAQELAAARDREHRATCLEYERGRVDATLSDALEWERLGLGRLFFVDGVPTWHPGDRA